MDANRLRKADFSEVASETLEEHVYRTYLIAREPDLLDRLALEYVHLRSALRVPLSNVLIDGIEIVNEAELQRLLVRATTPARRPGPLDIARADFGELLAYIALREMFGTRFGWLPLRDREVASQPARGMDLVGIEDDPNTPLITVIMHETKVSEDTASPPQVVDSGDDCLRAQHLAYIGDSELAARHILDAARRAEDEDVRDRLLLAGLYVQSDRRDRLRLIASSSLVRSLSVYRPSDYGSFRSTPQRYLPLPIRFLIICTADAVSAVVTAWYERVRLRGEERV